MITIAFTYRNRDLNLVRKCFQSLAQQTNRDFEVLFVNYGSNATYSTALGDLLNDFSFVTLIDANVVHKQLWNKSRALNIALKQCTTPYFFVGDVDMIFKTNFVEKLHTLKHQSEVHFFQVGFLSETESQQDKKFEDYSIHFLSTKEATGMTLYPTELLFKVNGYNEFYHGWGAEDTDAHARILNLNLPVVFHDDEVLLLHQWHPKTYRSKSSTEPFHSTLEKINHHYLKYIKNGSITTTNQQMDWGLLPNSEHYQKLLHPTKMIDISTEVNEVEAMLCYLKETKLNQSVCLQIQKKSNKKSPTSQLKRILKKNKTKTYQLDEINDKLLLFLITNFRNHAYEFEWDKKEEIIVLKILL